MGGLCLPQSANFALKANFPKLFFAVSFKNKKFFKPKKACLSRGQVLRKADPRRVKSVFFLNPPLHPFFFCPVSSFCSGLFSFCFLKGKGPKHKKTLISSLFTGKKPKPFNSMFFFFAILKNNLFPPPGREGFRFFKKNVY